MTGALPTLGFGLPVAGAWSAPDPLVHVARRAEELGYASLWTFQRVLHPVDAQLPATHRSVLDPLVALAFVAGQTERIGLGTATICAPFTAPALLAKALASLDVVSGGRLTVGLGTGWLPEEFVAAGVPFEGRGARFDEYLEALVALWTEDPVEVDGVHYRVPRSHVGPAPVQRPHPPILIGAAAAPGLRRAGRLAQGWICSSEQAGTGIAASVEVVRASALAAGRDPDAVRILVRVVPDLLDDDPGPGRRRFQGTQEQVLADLAALGAEGATEAFLDLNLSPLVGHPDAALDEALAHADRVLDAFAPGRASGDPGPAAVGRRAPLTPPVRPVGPRGPTALGAPA